MSVSATQESFVSGRVAADIPALRLLYWTVRRELWEYRSVYLAPLAVAALILVGFTFSLVDLPDRLRAAAALDPMKRNELVEQPYTFAALLFMLTSVLVGAFYCLEALYAERRDRSVLFWKSLPVSDLMIVLAKASVPILILPLVTFVVTVVTQGIMLVLANARLATTDVSRWSFTSFAQTSWILLNHLVMGHGLWYAPIWAWLLLCSAWSRRAPFLWATLPPLAIGLVESIAFNTSYLGRWLASRVMGGPQEMVPNAPTTMAGLMPENPLRYLVSPGFWVGLALTAVFLALAVRLRRQRGPV